MPYYATKEQLEICSDKARFKEHCRKFDVPVIEEYNLDSLLQGGGAESFPVIVKPVDSYASQGITVCHSLQELEQGYQKAQERSKTGKVIIERFIDNSHGVEMYYTVKNGHIVLTAMTDRYVHKVAEGHPPLPTETRFPSKHLNHYLEDLDAKVREMIRGMGIENGLLFIQSLHENGKFYLYEMGFRLSGEQHYQIIEKQTGINLLEMMLDFQTGGNMDAYPIERFDDGFTKFPACNLALFLNAGQIEKIIGMEKILEMPGVLSFLQLKKEGDEVEAIGNYGQMLGRFNIDCNDERKLNDTLNKIYDTIKVLSTEGTDLIEGDHATVPER
ncbi:MAG TPA: ATP-grasp domain-containing protein [Planococcus sp. (in: firmicutes)]|nr:ATP-grasp domain-containing protein [Planococcus sp. (in: firmicutes)]